MGEAAAGAAAALVVAMEAMEAMEAMVTMTPVTAAGDIHLDRGARETDKGTHPQDSIHAAELRSSSCGRTTSGRQGSARRTRG